MTSLFKILAVDDEEEIRISYQQTLEERQRGIRSEIESVFGTAEPTTSADSGPAYRFQLTLADQGERAVSLAQEAVAAGEPFRVAFLDMRMPPGIDGLETAKRLRKIDERIYIVFVTAYSDRPVGELHAAMEHDILLLRKPFIKEEIYQLARSLSISWQHERSLEEALELANQANRAKDQFLAAMSHEFRTPISGILGGADVLETTELDELQQEMVEMIRSSGNNLLHRVNDVLDASKMESGRLEIQLTPFVLGELLVEVGDLFQQQAQSKGIELKIENKIPYSGRCIGDRNRILQIISNLVGNAVKFSNHGLVHLRASSEATGGILIEVEDNGIGISNELLGKVFEPFSQGDQSLSRAYSGIGMGLHISRQLAERMGGELRGSSREQEGSCFTLRLPLLQEKREAEDSKEIAFESGEQLNGRVLVVEDTPEMQIFIQHLLTSWGVQSSVAVNGMRAVETALSERFDLILMDLQMPVMGGIDATEMLRQTGYSNPIIALTANVTEEHRDRFQEAGGDDYLNKPINQVALKRILDKYLPVLTPE